MELRKKLIVDSHFTAYDDDGQPRLIKVNEIFVYPAIDGVVKIEVDRFEFKVRQDVLEAHTHVPA